MINKLDKKIRQYIGVKERNARSVSNVTLWVNVDNSRNAYGTSRKFVSQQDPSSAEDIDYKAYTSDYADQTDEQISLGTDLIKTNKILYYRPNGTVSETEAELLTVCQETLLAECDFDSEMRDAYAYFIKYPCSAVKVCRESTVEYLTTKSVEPNPTPMELMGQGFDEELIASGQALVDYFAINGKTYIEPADADPLSGLVTSSVVTSSIPVTNYTLGIRACDPRRIAFSDFVRKYERQQSIHQYWYWSVDEMRKCGMKNLESFKDKQGETSTNMQNPNSSIADSVADGIVSEDPFFEITETWTELPIKRWVEEGEVTQEEAVEFARIHGISFNEFNNEYQKWCVYHYKDEAILRIYPNYLLNKTCYPYDIASFIPDENRCVGSSFGDRISPLTATKQALFNLLLENTKRIAFQPIISGRRSEITQDDINNLFSTKNGYLNLDTTLTDVRQEFMFVETPSVKEQCLDMISVTEKQIDMIGVSPILRGEGQAKTATQDSINNRRGQTLVNDAFDRFVKMVMSSMVKHLGCMLITYSPSKFVEILGENGTLLTRKWTEPNQIIDKLKPIQAVSFKDSFRQQEVASLTAALNIGAPILPPNVFLNIFFMLLEKMGLSQEDLDQIKDQKGSFTDVYKEIEAMTLDPQLEPEVRMEDPHEICMQMAMTQIQILTQRNAMYGFPPPDTTNFITYIQKHEQMLAHILQMQMMSQMMGGGNNLQGKPKQDPADQGSDDISKTKQQAQIESPADSGIATNAGMTGNGSTSIQPTEGMFR